MLCLLPLEPEGKLAVLGYVFPVFPVFPPRNNANWRKITSRDSEIKC